MEKITFAERIKEARKNAKLTQQQLADIVGRTKSAVSRWESGENTPQLFDLVKIENAVGVPGKVLMYGTDELKPSPISDINHIISQLDSEYQIEVLKFSKMQLNIQKARAKRKIKIKMVDSNSDKQEKDAPIKLYPIKAKEHVALAAGNGYSYNDNGEYSTYYTLRNDFPCFDEAVPVEGQSMEPRVNDGDIALIKTNYSKINGQIYAFDYDGKSYIKYLYFYNDKIIVKSENDNFNDWEISFEELTYDNYLYFNIVGEVVDWFTPVLV
ncbi:helix-turn-helix domain-containing protein [Lactococcus sp. S64]|uniref:XRE family transcriptional regulator n=1 Tax=Lactococcus sp. S64 TaxID=2767459 RepID=UPI00190565ED|nr:S24 family peptidase [Lactococcus sp. S64]MBK0084383.1 helix-turn-helix domain-containing protein [Lactococcus sp. S64]